MAYRGEHKTVSSNAYYAVAIILLPILAACGGGGGDDADEESHPPVASNLQISRQSAFLNDGGGQIQIAAQADFFDAGGDVSGYILEIYNSNSDLLQTLDGSIGGTGVTSASGGLSLTVNTSIVDEYRFEFAFIDARGDRSNSLDGTFPIRGPETVPSNLPDSGANRCYDQTTTIDCPEAGQAFYGQDFIYSSNQLSFTDNGDGTVTDNVTQLVWQKDNIDSYNWYQASGTFDITYNASFIDACNISLGGRGDWRLPTRRELLTIVDYGHDMHVLASSDLILAGPDYWALENDGSDAKFVDFVDGSVAFDQKTINKSVRCVSGDQWGLNQFQDNGDGTVSDLASGLMWRKSDQGTGNDWQSMLSSCEDLSFAGYDDWRLADIRELETTIGTEPFLDIGQGIYCSSTTVAGETDSVWVIQFHSISNYGDLFNHAAGNSKQTCSSFYSRCVR